VVRGSCYSPPKQHYPVLTAGQVTSEVLLRRVRPAGGILLHEPLENTYWKLTGLGEGRRVASRQKELHFILKLETRRVGGSGAATG